MSRPGSVPALSSGPGSQLHHPSPLPPINSHYAGPASATGRDSPAVPLHSAAAAQEPKKEDHDAFEVTTTKKEGSDWLTMFNPNVKRVVDVGLVHTLVHDSVVCCVQFSQDGKTLATGCNRNTTLYDTKTGAKIT